MGCRRSITKSSCSCNQCKACSSHNTECPDIAVALEVANAWNIPACNANAVLYIPYLTIALIGSYIYNPTYGRFKIVGFNAVNGQVTIKNECLIENAAAGTVVPAGTTFVFGNPPTLTEYENWVPTVSADGGMTVDPASVVVDEAEYFSIGTTDFFNLTLRFTLGGIADTKIYVTMPHTMVTDSIHTLFPCGALQDSSGELIGMWRVGGPVFGPTMNTILIIQGYPTALAPFALGGVLLSIQGRVKVA